MPRLQYELTCWRIDSLGDILLAFQAERQIMQIVEWRLCPPQSLQGLHRYRLAVQCGDANRRFIQGWTQDFWRAGRGKGEKAFSRLSGDRTSQESKTQNAQGSQAN